MLDMNLNATGYKIRESRMFFSTLFSFIEKTLAALNDLSAIIAAIAVAWTAVIGKNVLNDWKEKKKLERKVKHAERIVIAACNAREALKRIRSPISFSGENESAEAAINKAISKGHRIELNSQSSAGMVCLERIGKENKHYVAVAEYVIISEAVFSERLSKALQNIISQYNSVGSAARILIQTSINITDDQRWFDRIWEENRGEGDEICNVIDEQIDIVKEECHPYIQADESQKSIWSLFRIIPEARNPKE